MVNKSKNLKRGFTLYELVIVLAVIAILAAILIPTFTGVVGKAKKFSAFVEAKNVYTEFLSSAVSLDDYSGNAIVDYKEGGKTTYTFYVKAGEFGAENYSFGSNKTTHTYTFDGKVAVTVDYEVNVDDLNIGYTENKWEETTSQTTDNSDDGNAVTG